MRKGLLGVNKAEGMKVPLRVELFLFQFIIVDYITNLPITSKEACAYCIAKRTEYCGCALSSPRAISATAEEEISVCGASFLVLGAGDALVLAILDTRIGRDKVPLGKVRRKRELR